MLELYFNDGNLLPENREEEQSAETVLNDILAGKTANTEISSVKETHPIIEAFRSYWTDIELSLRMNATTGPSSQPSTSIHTIHLMPSYRQRKIIP